MSGHRRDSPPDRRALIAAGALAALVVVVPGPADDAGATARKPYTTVPGPSRSDARFVVTYSGSGSWRTRFHATPPNPGGKSDTNDASDSSRQAWDVKFRRTITIPACGQPADGSADPCASLSGTNGASGPTELTGLVNHKHVDGLYRQFDRTVKCRLQKRPSARRKLNASIHLRYLPGTQSIAVSASDPIATAVALFPSQCPKQGDSIDRIFDFYAMPGFSFADGYGPERWLGSGEVLIPADAFLRSAKIRIPLGDTREGTPPRRCAVRDPSFERCKTGGSWSGVVTLTAQPGTVSPPSKLAVAAAASVKVPRSGQYSGHTGGKAFTLYTSGKSIQLAAFDFKCRNTTGRTSLNSIKLKKTRKGYAFAISAHGSISFADNRPDENGAIALAGRFARDGKSASGTLRVKSHRCRDTGIVNWKARR